MVHGAQVSLLLVEQLNQLPGQPRGRANGRDCRPVRVAGRVRVLLRGAPCT